MPNRLASSASPYLLQHAENPVDWFPWGDEALKKAKAEDKLIFLSVGYSSCHWCHVMEHESFEDPETAGFLNKHFVSIKVDREERPDIDALYMESVQMMTGRGGWPMSVWLTPDCVPVFGGTYFPPRPVHGQPSFMQILHRLQEIWTTDRKQAESRAEEIKKAMTRDLIRQFSGEGINETHFSEAASHFSQQFDSLYGGFSPAPKFPMAMGISFLLRHGHITGENKGVDQALFSLRCMMRGGIYDHIGGGFHRYSTDSRWFAPHFEKMLYDNALLLNALCDAWLLTKDEEFRSCADETLAFLNREMKHVSGGYFSALDADTEGKEGRFYVWSRDDVGIALSEFPEEDTKRFCDTYNLDETGNWEGSNIFHLAPPSETEFPVKKEDIEQFSRMRKVLLKKRDERTRPGLDDKIITSWNAMLLKSLCRMSRAFGSTKLHENALELAGFLHDSMQTDDGRLMRIFKDGAVSQPGFLDDIALLAEAFTHVFEINGEAKWLNRSHELCVELTHSFYDSDNHGFFYSSTEHERLLGRNRDIFDNAVPAGNSAAVSALWRCGLLTGNADFMKIAREATEKLISTASKHASSFGYALDHACRMFYHEQEIVISGPEPESFLSLYRADQDFTRFVIPSDNAASIPYPPFRDKKPVGGKTACYICSGFTCQKPLTDPDKVPGKK